MVLADQRETRPATTHLAAALPLGVRVDSETNATR
jgi:hypothetical protein